MWCRVRLVVHYVAGYFEFLDAAVDVGLHLIKLLLAHLYFFNGYILWNIAPTMGHDPVASIKDLLVVPAVCMQDLSAVAGANDQAVPREDVQVYCRVCQVIKLYLVWINRS